MRLSNPAFLCPGSRHAERQRKDDPDGGKDDYRLHTTSNRGEIQPLPYAMRLLASGHLVYNETGIASVPLLFVEKGNSMTTDELIVEWRGHRT
jgi:hypothetical protein